MASTDIKFQIPEVSVEGTNKTWGGPTNQANGTVVSFTAIPVFGADPWTPEQAEVVAFDLRRRIQVLLLADAQIRGTPPPPGGAQVLESYTKILETLKKKVSGTEWREKGEPLTGTEETSSTGNPEGNVE
jgi:hypothetical protein